MKAGYTLDQSKTSTVTKQPSETTTIIAIIKLMPPVLIRNSPREIAAPTSMYRVCA